MTVRLPAVASLAPEPADGRPLVELLSHLRRQGVRLAVEDGSRLRLQAPPGVLTPELQRELQQRKAEILAFLGGEADPGPALAPLPRDQPLPLSLAQRRLWVLHRLDPASSAYNLPRAYRLEAAELSLPRWRQVFAEITRRHETLRTTFAEEAGEPVQVVWPGWRPRPVVVDLTGLDVRHREREGLRLAEREGRRPFDLAAAPPLRLALLALGDGAQLALVTLHHVAADGWSMGVLLSELGTLSQAYAAGCPSPLPELAVQYGDYAGAQARFWGAGRLAREVERWRRELAEMPRALALPTDRPRRADRRRRGASVPVVLSPALSARLEAVGREGEATLFMVLLAGFQAFLARTAAQPRVLLGVPTAGRDSPQLEGLIGFFVNTAVVPGDLTGGPTGRELLERTRRGALAALGRHPVPVEQLVEELVTVRDLTRPPLFQVLFSFQNAPPGSFAVPGLAVTAVEAGELEAKFELTLSLEPVDGGVRGTLGYDADLFDGTTARRWGAALERLLAGLARYPDRPVAELPLLSPAERHQLLWEWNDTRRGELLDGSREDLGPLLAEALAAAPDAVALVFEDRQLSAGELARRAGRGAARLAALGVGPERPVGLLCERRLELLISWVAVWWAGAAYVPVAADGPAERRRGILRDAGVAAVLGPAEALPELAGLGVPLLPWGGPGSLFAPGADPLGPVATPPQALAYRIYTSGSTGVPKGVAVERGAVVHLLRILEPVVYATPPRRLRVAVQAPLYFDASVKQLVQLLAGRTLVLVAEELRLEAAALAVHLAAAAVDAVDVTPSLLEVLLDEGLAGQCPGCRVLVGGEAVAAGLWRRLAGSPLAAFNVYGPTETTVDVTARPITGEVPRPVLGRPLANVTARVLEPGGEPAPVGVAGELVVGGRGVARGYTGRPAATAGRFEPDPWGPPGARRYRTGDRARWTAAGELEFLGRADQQVKIRGFRAEPGEAEAALLALPGVREVAVVAAGEGEGTRLVGFAVPASGTAATGDALRGALAERLPAYLVPAVVELLPALPRTANGKLDRRALTERAAALERPAPVFTPPQAGTEERLAALWEELLGRGPVGAGDDFFALGGHSLLATRLASAARRAFAVELPVRRVFERPVLRDLAAEVDGLLGSPGEAPPILPLAPVLRAAGVPLSFGQERLWFLDRLSGGGAAYNLSSVTVLTGAGGPRLPAAVFGEVVRRHEVLRTVYAEEDGRVLQRVLPWAAPPLPVVDLTALAPAHREAERKLLAREEAVRGFDLARGPVLRAVLLATGAATRVLLSTVHHIATDGGSQGLLRRELAELHGAFRAGRPSPLAEPPVQYGDFAVDQRQRLAGERLAAALGFWRRQLAGAPPALELPTDRPRPRVQTYAGGTCPVRLPAPLAAALAAFARDAGATPFMAVLAAFGALLSRHSGQSRVVIGSPISGRDRAELEPLLGFFVNTLALPVDATGGPSWRTLLERVRRTVVESFAHAELPFERLVDDLVEVRDGSRTPLFQAVVTLAEGGAGLALEDLGVHHLDEAPVVAKFDLTLALERGAAASGAGGLAGVLIYNRDLFDGTTARRLADRFARLLQGALVAPDRPLPELDLLAPGERHQLLWEWAGEVPDPVADTTVPALFRAQVALRPEAPAVRFTGGEWSYRELGERAARLARRLRALGVRRGTPVAVALRRSPELPAVLLAVLEAGGFYVPVDPDYPAERQRYLLADSGAPVLVTTGELLPLLPASGLAVLDLAREEAGQDLPEVPAEAMPGPGDLAYVLYTSGSTGEPKGVAVPHRAVARLVHRGRFADLSPERTFLALAPVAFDASTLELWAPLGNGGVLAVAPLGRVGPAVLAAVLPALRVDSLWLTAALFHQVVDEAPQALAGLAQLLAGGDVLSPEHCRRALAAAPGLTLINGYGPTENTTFTACHRLVEPLLAPVPIGRPIDGTRVWIVDGDLRPVPVGVVGELVTGGAGLARGYWRRPGLTARGFVPDPLSGEPGARLYRTGDRARWRADGRLEFLGRLDGQVKIRGFRVEPGEVESALRRHPAVREAVLLAPGEGERRRLLACVAGEAEAAELQGFLAERLPAHLVPSAIVVLERLPVTANGKVDRRALLELAPEPPAAQGEVPRDAVEEVVAAAFAAVLELPAVGRDDDFFALGGHSLSATRVVSRLREATGVELPLERLFEHPTVATLARTVEQALREDRPAPPPLLPLPPAARERPLPLSFAQRRLWFLDRLEPGLTVYHIATAVALTGPAPAVRVGQALTEVVRRHQVLRTVLVEDGGEPFQVIRPVAPAALPVADLSGLAPPDRERALGRLAAEHGERPFNLARGPVARFHRLELDPGRSALLAAFHHVAADGWSLGVLLSELQALLPALAAGRPSPLPELALQYADFAVWQRAYLQGPVLEQELEHWRRALAGAPPLLALPTDRPRPPLQTYRGRTREVVLPPALTAAARELARAQGATLYMVLLSAFALVLSRQSGQDDLVVGSPIAGRTRRETEGLMGLFVNTLALRCRLAGAASFREVLSRVRRGALEAYAHQDVPFERLVEEVVAVRDLSYPPLFQVMLVLQNAPQPRWEVADLTLEPLPGGGGGAKFDLLLALAEVDGGLAGSFEANRDLFDSTTVGRLWERFRGLLEAVMETPGVPLPELPWTPLAERHQVLHEWNDGARAAAPGATLPELFRRAVERTPEAEALVTGSERFTYRELFGRASRLARLLVRRGVGPEVRVGVGLGRDSDLVVALLAVLEAGGAYVPLDPAYPAERLAFLAADAAVALVVTRGGLLPEAVTAGRPVLDLAAAGPELAAESEVPLPPRALAGNLAYLIYTSGSTGRPKGVAIEHRSAVALLVWARRWFGDQELAGMLAATSVNFDLSVFELFLPLAWGGRVILADNALALPELPARDLVRLVNTVPSAMTELVRLGAVPPGVATVCLAGEPLPRALAEGLYGTGTVERVWNLYGPSEDTTYSTAARVGRGTEPTIGRAVDGTGAWVLDRELRPLGIGAPGELYLSGVGLARGYLGRPALTAERFLPAPVGEEPGARMYRTGDRARWLPGGELQFLGRLDHQVKVRGFRIELGEVESALRSHPRVLEAAVLAPGEGADRRLLAYVAAPEAPPQPAELAAHLRRTLPEALVPAVIVVLPELPHTPNGKVDRKALAALQAVPAAGAGDPPRGALEKLLAEAFAEVLGVPRVSRGDGFFALGGHSLAAVRLRARLRERAHLDLPLPALFSAPTVETLAARLASGAVGQGWSESLVPLAQSGPGEPVFLVHPVGGQVSCYRPLATALSSAHPVWGLQRPGFDVLAAAAGLEELAAHYAEALVAVTPEGPFLLAGWSLGGVIAFEAARQLAGRGCAPRAVVLIDAAVPAGPPPGVVLEERAAALFARDLVAQHPGLTAREVETRLRRRGRSVIGAGAAPWQELPVEELSAVFAANLRAADGYRPAAQAVPLLVLRAAEGDPRGRDRWGGLAHGPFLERQLPGDHYSLLRPPGVERLAVAWAEGLAELTGEPEDRR